VKGMRTTQHRSGKGTAKNAKDAKKTQLEFSRYSSGTADPKPVIFHLKNLGAASSPKVCLTVLCVPGGSQMALGDLELSFRASEMNQNG
jgi:hypothetical protein